MNDVRTLAVDFRQAILDCPDTGLVTLEDFPKGSCGDTSPILGEFLRERGYGDWEYVAGCRQGDYHSHAWLEQDGWLLDITADQFPDVHDPVVLTQNRMWHSQFMYAPMRRRVAGIDMFDEHTNSRLAEAYNRIMAVYERS